MRSRKHGTVDDHDGRGTARWCCTTRADPLGRFYYNIFRSGDTLGWHFDNSPFSINLILGECKQGGDLQVRPRPCSPNHTVARPPCMAPTVRSHKNKCLSQFIPNSRAEWEQKTEFPAETELQSKAHTADLAAGSLYLFHGSAALHRVTPVM